jgi:hypothetical protein
MKIYLIILAIFIFYLFPGRGCYAVMPEDSFPPIETCTLGKNIDEFLAEFGLNKVNKIVLKAALDDEDTSRRTTLTVIKNKGKIKSVLSSIHNVKCLDDFILEDCPIELWLYENTKLRLKVAFSVIDNLTTITRFYKPLQSTSLGENDFVIDDAKLCSWLDELTGKYFKIPVEDQ